MDGSGSFLEGEIRSLWTVVSGMKGIRAWCPKYGQDTLVEQARHFLCQRVFIFAPSSSVNHAHFKFRNFFATRSMHLNRHVLRTRPQPAPNVSALRFAPAGNMRGAAGRRRPFGKGKAAPWRRRRYSGVGCRVIRPGQRRPRRLI